MSESSERKIILPVGDSRLNEFIRRAGPIITAERGLNERSRLKLRSLADSLKLPNELFDLALEHFRQSGIEPKDKLTRFERAFVNWLTKHLNSTQQKILSTELEQAGLTHGTEKYQLTIDRARQLIHEVARDLGLQRVSLKQAESYLHYLVTDQIGSATVLNEQLRERLYRAAESWGVEIATVDGYIEQWLTENSNRERPSGTSRRVLALGSCALLIGITLYAYSIYQRQQHDPTVESDQNQLSEVEPSTDKSGAPFESSDLPPIALMEPHPNHPEWSETTIERLHAARPTTGLLDQYWNVLAAAEPDGRVALISELTASALAGHDETQRQAWVELLVLTLEIEPDPQTLETMISELTHRITVTSIDSSLTTPALADDLEDCFRSNQLAFQVWRTLDETSLPRRLLGQGLFNQTSVNLDALASVDTDEMFSEAYLPLAEQGLARQWLDYLTTLARLNPEQAGQFVIPIRQGLSDKLDHRSLNDRLEDILLMILENSPQSITHLKPVADEVIRNADHDRILAWGELLHSTQDHSLRQWLTTQLVLLLDIDRILGEEQQLSLIRSQILARQSELIGGHHALIRQWLTHNELLSKLVESDQLPNATAQNIADIAQWGTQAFALSRGQFELFQRLYQEPQAPLAMVAIANASRETLNLLDDAPFTAHATHHETLDKALAVLADKEVRPVTRAAALQRISAVADRFADIEFEQAQLLMTFLLNAQSDDEVIAIRKELGKLRHWLALQQALINQLESTTAPTDHLLTICRLLTDESFELATSDNWRAVLKIQLLSSLTGQLKIAIVRRNAENELLWDQLHDRLCDEMILRLRIVHSDGIPQDAYTLLIRTMTKAISSELNAANWQLDDYLAEDELHRAILAGRRLIDGVARAIGKRNPQIEHKITKIVTWHVVHSNQLQHYRDQLLLNELTLLKLWTSACQAN